MTSPLLKIENLYVAYGMIEAVRRIDLSIYPGEVVCLLGANGAGKTTTLKTISGLVPCKSGQIYFKNETITSMPAHKRVALGLAQSPEGRMIFPDLTVKENLEMGHFLRKDQAEIKSNYDYVYHLFPRVYERRLQLAGTLSGGEQQMVAIGRALMSNPDLLLLDEPSLGLAPKLVETIFRAITEINQRGKTVLLVEQNAFGALKVSHRAYVLETGEITLHGEAQKLINDEKIRSAYLGE